jgi:glycine oxidase
VVFYEHEPLVSLVSKKGAIQAAQTAHHAIEAKQYVICAGAWSGQLLQHVLPPLEVIPVRGQMLLFALPKPPFSPLVYGDGVYGVPRRDGHFLLGATVEEAGFNRLPTQEAYRLLFEKSQRLGLDMPKEALVAQWTGLRPALRRLWPVVDRHPQIENLFKATGHFRYGLTTAFSSAAMLLDLMQGRQVLPLFRWPLCA